MECPARHLHDSRREKRRERDGGRKKKKRKGKKKDAKKIVLYKNKDRKGSRERGKKYVLSPSLSPLIHIFLRTVSVALSFPNTNFPSRSRNGKLNKWFK